jgi:hypothetical protein
MLLAFPVSPLDVFLSAQHHAWDEQRKALKAAGPAWPPSPIPAPAVKGTAVIRLGYVGDPSFFAHSNRVVQVRVK